MSEEKFNAAAVSWTAYAKFGDSWRLRRKLEENLALYGGIRFWYNFNMNFLNIFKKEKTLPPYFKRILWSYDFELIDPVKDKKTVIVNAINYGDLRHWRWLAGFYGKKIVADILKNIPATEIRPRVRNLASVLFSISNFNYEPRSFN